MAAKHRIQNPQSHQHPGAPIHRLRRRGVWASPPVLHCVPTAPPGCHCQIPKQWPIHVIGRGRP